MAAGAKEAVSKWKLGIIPGGDLVLGITEPFDVTTDFLLRDIESKPMIMHDAPIDLTEFWQTRSLAAEKRLKKIKVLADFNALNSL